MCQALFYIFLMIPLNRYYYYYHFTDEKFKYIAHGHIAQKKKTQMGLNLGMSYSKASDLSILLVASDINNQVSFWHDWGKQ